MKSIQKDVIWRIAIIYIGACIFALIILGRAFYLQVAEKDKWTEKAKTLTLKNRVIEPSRGDICAKDGRLLSSSVPYYEVRMDMCADGLSEKTFVDNVDSLSICLSKLFQNKSYDDHQKGLLNAHSRNNRYYLIKRNVTYTQLRELKKFPIFRLGKYKGGLIYHQKNKRVKPFGSLAFRTIGFVSEDEKGRKTRVGIEGAYDVDLRGVEGVGLMQKLSGNVWMPVGRGNEIEPKDGNDVISTIDVNIQDVAHKALLEQLKKHNAGNGCAVLMEVETGAVRAIVNLEKNEEGEYRERFNYAIGSSTEPGSTFKTASMMVALEDGVVELDDSVDTGNGVVYFYDHKMKDSHEGGYGKITVRDAFAYSSNVGISKIIYENYKDQPSKFVDRLYGMNLNERLGIEIKGEGKPMIKVPVDKLWSGISLPWMSIGYEVELAPIQILAFYNAIANNGKMMKPMFVSGLQEHGQVVKPFEPKVLRQSICSESTIIKIQELLEAVVEYGTATNLKNKNYKIAGKTGTSQINYSKRGEKLEYRASFVGYFPADEPKYSCIVVVSAPSNDVYYGSYVAGPVFKEIADRIYATSFDCHEELNTGSSQMIVDYPVSTDGYKEYLDCVYDALRFDVSSPYEISSPWVITSKKDSGIVMENRRVLTNLVPKVEGMGLMDAIYLLENAGLRVKVDIGSRGTVKTQSIQAGTKVQKGQQIILELRV